MLFLIEAWGKRFEEYKNEKGNNLKLFHDVYMALQRKGESFPVRARGESIKLNQGNSEGGF